MHRSFSETHSARKSLANRGRKLVFVANEFENFRHHRAHLVRAVVDHGVHPVLLAAPVGVTADFPCEFRPLPLDRFALRPWIDLRIFARLLWIILTEQPCAVHLFHLKPNLLGGLAARVARLCGWTGALVVTVAGLGRLYAEEPGFGHRLRRIIAERLLRIGMKRARVTFETQEDSDVWISRRIIHRQQASVTRGAGLDLDRFVRRPETRQAGRLRVLFAGRLLKAKGLDLFLSAARSITRADVEFLVAGREEQDPDALCAREITECGRVRYLGHVDDMADLLTQVDVVVLPSRYREGIPRILIEAAACGCIPVATRFAGSKEVIVDGKTGFLLKNDSVEALVELIDALAVCAQDRETIGHQAAEHVRAQGFSAQDVTQAFLRLYQL